MRKILSVLICLSVLLAGCQAATAPTKMQETEKKQNPVVATIEPESVEKDQTILRFAGADLIVADPARALDFNSSTAVAHLYDTLVFPNKDAGTDPWLAESWDISDDQLIYTFHIRKGVKFHDGTEVFASDVVYSYNRFATIGQGYFYLLPKADSIKAVDDYTVEFVLTKPSGLFIPSLIRLYVLNEELVRENTKSAGDYGENGDYGIEWLTTHDAGSGPYRIKEFPLEQYILMEKNVDWWGNMREDAPDLFKIIATTEPVTVRNLMANKELEISDMWQTIESLTALDAITGVDITVAPSLLGFYYMMNNKKPPFDDIHCRKAAAYGFDYESLLSLEWPGTELMIGPVPRSLGGWDPNVLTYRYDVAKAKEELAQCKYADELDKYPITVNWPDAVPAEEKFALLFQSNMAELGMVVNIQALPLLSMEENVSSVETSPNIASFYVSSDLSEAGLMLQSRYASTTAGTWLQVEWLQDPELDAAIQDALDTVDVDERFSKYGTLQNLIMELCPSLFMYEFPMKHAVQDYVDWKPEENSQIAGYSVWAPLIGINNSTN